MNNELTSMRTPYPDVFLEEACVSHPPCPLKNAIRRCLLGRIGPLCDFIAWPVDIVGDFQACILNGYMAYLETCSVP